MAFVGIVLLLIASTSSSLARQCDCRHGLNFRGRDVTQYGISRGSPKALTAITACLWISVPERYLLKKNLPAPLSYAAKGAKGANEFTFFLFRSEGMSVYIRGFRYRTGVKVADGKLHHVCVTWESSSGQLKVYKDAALVKTIPHVQTGRTIRAGGIWVIGQDQDNFFGGAFERKNAMKGKLAEANIWNREFCPYEVTRVAKDCGTLYPGNYKAFGDFSPSYNAEWVKMPCCPPQCIRKIMKF